MKVILTALGSAGDVFPFVGLGRALRARGHEVALIANPQFEAAARGAGLELLPLGTAAEYRAAVADPKIWDPAWGFRYVMQHMTAAWSGVYRLLEQAVEPGRTVIAAHYMDYGARSFRDRHETPLATMVLSPLILRSRGRNGIWRAGLDLDRLPPPGKRLFFWVVDRLFVDPILRPPLDRLRAEVGLPPVRRPMAGWMFSPDLTVGLFPEWFAPPQPDWPPRLRLTGFVRFDAVEPVSAEIERFLAAGAAPIAFTPGSAVADAAAFLATAVEACRLLGRRGLLLAGWGEPPSGLPPEVHFARFAPLSAVLPRCAALVHHGGIGTTAAALAAGRPQVVLPMSHDQPDNAARVRRLGVGDWLLPVAASGPALAARLRRLLDAERVAERCAALAEAIGREDAVGATCDLLGRLLSEAAGGRWPAESGRAS